MWLKRTGMLVVFVLVAAFGSFVSAQASTQAAGCRAAPYSASFSRYFETETYQELGSYTTSSQCNDINLRSTNGTSFFACVVFVNHGTACNQGYTAPASGAWVNIATDVLDGTRFNVRVYKGGANGVTHSGVMDF